MQIVIAHARYHVTCIVRARLHRRNRHSGSLFFDIYNVFQWILVNFRVLISNPMYHVCQLVSVEHFSRKTFFKMAAKKIKDFNCFTFRVIQSTIASVIKSISGVLGNLPSFPYFKMQWPCD